jgi:hypothetical protein
MTLLLFFNEWAIAYSAIAVLPAEVWAHTRTDSSHSIAWTLLRWNGSSLNLYCLASYVPWYYLRM